ncbi:MAG: deaminase [Bacilli bacterium]|nr:deaminase [Bacilli bacterium]
MIKAVMKSAEAVALLSEDPRTKVGCVLKKGKKTVGVGHNHMPRHSLVKFPWGHEGSLELTKYPYVIHAEMAAITSHRKLPRGYDAYVTLFPCSNCAKLLVQTGCKKIYYTSDKYADTPDTIASKELLKGCGIEFEKVYL